MHGDPYNDYFINRPPMIFSAIGLWGDIFSYRYFSWVLLELTCVSVIVWALNSIFKHFLTSVNRQTILFLSTITLLFSGLTDMFLASELIAISLILAACAVAVNTESPNNNNILVAASLILSAAFIREQFLLIPILFATAVIALAIETRSLKLIYSAVQGFLVAITFVSIYFFRHQNFNNFVSIFSLSYVKEKSGLSNYFEWSMVGLNSIQQYFAPSDYFKSGNVYSWIGLVFPMVLIFLLSIAILARHRPVETSRWKWLIINQVGLGFILATGWQSRGSRFLGHYGLVTFVGFLLTFVVFLRVFRITLLRIVRFSSLVNVSILALTLILLIPNISTLKTLSSSIENVSLGNFSKMIRSDYESMTFDERSAFELMNSAPNDFKCSVQVYGWGTAAWYYYTRSEPCSRYFLVNLISDNESFSEYRLELTVNPPLVISYRCLEPECSDLEYQGFEERGFPFRQVLNHCYKLVHSQYPYFKREGLYFAKMSTKNRQSLCIKHVLDKQ